MPKDAYEMSEAEIRSRVITLAFGGDEPRTWARPSRFGVREVLLIMVGALLAGTAVVVAVATGQWVFIGS